MARGRQTFDQWIGEATSDGEKEGDCTMLSVVHIKGSSQNEVYSISLDKTKQWTIIELAKVLRGKAENYAEELTGVQSFALLAFYGGRNEPQATKPFNINGPNEFEGLASEGPTGQGLVAQSMRHTEAMLQICAKQTSMLFSSTQSTIDSLSKQNAQLMQENRDSFEIMQHMMRERASGMHEHNMEQLKFERQTADRQKLLEFAPALVNSITGREVFPQNNEDTALIEKFIESVDEGALEALSTHLPPEILGLLAQRMEKSFRKKRLEEEDGDARLSEGVNPEEDAAGGEE